MTCNVAQDNQDNAHYWNDYSVSFPSIVGWDEIRKLADDSPEEIARDCEQKPSDKLSRNVRCLVHGA